MLEFLRIYIEGINLDYRKRFKRDMCLTVTTICTTWERNAFDWMFIEEEICDSGNIPLMKNVTWADHVSRIDLFEYEEETDLPPLYIREGALLRND